jgi:hypothetical protein
VGGKLPARCGKLFRPPRIKKDQHRKLVGAWWGSFRDKGKAFRGRGGSLPGRGESLAARPGLKGVNAGRLAARPRLKGVNAGSLPGRGRKPSGAGRTCCRSPRVKGCQRGKACGPPRVKGCQRGKAPGRGESLAGRLMKIKAWFRIGRSSLTVRCAGFSRFPEGRLKPAQRVEKNLPPEPAR